MHNIISFSFTPYSFYPILAGIFYVIRTFSFSLFLGTNINALFFEIVLLEFGMFLSFILELINIIRQSTKHNGFHAQIQEWLYKYKEKKILLAMFICGVFDFIAVFLTFIILSTNNTFQLHISSLMRITEFFFVSFLYYFFLKKSLYRHHYISLALITIGLICVFAQGISSFQYTIIYNIIGNFFYAMNEILYNWIMEYKFVSSYELVAISGLFGCVLGTIICLIFSNIKCVDWLPICNERGTMLDYINEIKNIFSNKWHLIEVGAFVFFSLCYNTFHFLTNKNLSPTHRIIGDSVSSIFTMIITIIKGNQPSSSLTVFILLQLIGHVPIVLGIVIYNEMMIVHLCGLDVNTTKAIKERANDDNLICLLAIKKQTKRRYNINI